MAGRLAPASMVAGGHILKRAWSANFKMVLYVLLRPLRPELDGRPSSANFSYSCTKLVTLQFTYCTNVHMIRPLIQPYNSSSKFLILILVDFSHFAVSSPPCVQPLNTPKHKILNEIPPYYIDTLSPPTTYKYGPPTKRELYSSSSRLIYSALN
jgi:hypothetical protein